jgi:hypothetical protein
MGRSRRTAEIAEMLSLVKAELPPSSVPNDPDITDVALRAYEIYESRGRADGADLDDWRQAELESHAQNLASTVGPMVGDQQKCNKAK